MQTEENGTMQKEKDEEEAEEEEDKEEDKEDAHFRCCRHGVPIMCRSSK